MNSDEELEVKSPPFPLPEDNSAILHKQVLELYEWLEYYRESSNKFRGIENCIAKPAKPATFEFHNNMPLPRLVSIQSGLYDLRMLWDTVVRSNERNWESNRCKDACHAVFHIAAQVLDNAYVSDELREARRITNHEHHILSLLGPLGKILKAQREQQGEEGTEE